MLQQNVTQLERSRGEGGLQQECIRKPRRKKIGNVFGRNLPRRDGFRFSISYSRIRIHILLLMR